MSQQIEQLKHGTTLIFPRTSQEAVLVIYKIKYRLQEIIQKEP